MACFGCNMTENFIFLLKYCQPKVHLNTIKKSLVFVTIEHMKFHIYVWLLYTKISYLRQNTHLRKDAAFLNFVRRKAKTIWYLKRKHTKTNKNMFFSALFTNFHKTKNNFFIQCGWKSGDGVHILFTIPGPQFALKITKSMKWLFKGRE